MPQKAQARKPFFEVGHKVQLNPSWGLLGKSSFEGQYATITRVQLWPDPGIFEDPQDWHRGPHWVQFWVRLDDFPEQDDSLKQVGEIPLRYHELQPLAPRMGKQQLAQHCQERLMKEANEHRRDAYLQVMLYLTKGLRPIWPLSDLESHPVPKGHEVDLINRFVGIVTYLRNLAQERTLGSERYEAQAQVCEELSEHLMPKKRLLAHLP